MKYLIKIFAIIGLVSMSQLAVAIDNVVDGDAPPTLQILWMMR